MKLSSTAARISQRQEAVNLLIGVLGWPRLICKDKDEVSGCLGQKKGAMDSREGKGRPDFVNHRLQSTSKGTIVKKHTYHWLKKIG